MTSPRPGEALV
jgi:hypothetical protein